MNRRDAHLSTENHLNTKVIQTGNITIKSTNRHTDCTCEAERQFVCQRKKQTQTSVSQLQKRSSFDRACSGADIRARVHCTDITACGAGKTPSGLRQGERQTHTGHSTDRGDRYKYKYPANCNSNWLLGVVVLIPSGERRTAGKQN